MAIPNFPNFFCLYGPNTNIVVNGSIIYFSECGVRYVLGLVKCLLGQEGGAIEVKADVHDDFNEQVDAENRQMAWGWSQVNTWYQEQARAHRPELAVHVARVLAAHARAEPRRLRAHAAEPELTCQS